jgi:hypothetical protein
MYSDLKRYSVSTLLGMLVWTTYPVLGQSLTADTFTLSLRGYGWEPPERREVNGPSIVVDHAGRVLLAFTVRESNDLVTRDKPSLSFRIMRFGRDGKADLSLSLPTNAGGRNGIYLSDTDQIIARANGSLQLLRADESNPKEGVWKILAPCTLRCLVEQSVTRHTLFLYTPGADPPSMLIRLSQQPMVRGCGKAERLIESNDDKIQNYPQSITDEFAYFSLSGHTYRWPLCDYEHRFEMPPQIYGRWKVLNDKFFALNTSSDRKGHTDWGLEVISSDGQVKFRQDMVGHESAGAPIWSSERGDRIAVGIFTRRGGNRKLDISSHVTAGRIAVYDIESGKELASVRVNTKHRYGFEFDLSPDGNRLAILEDDAVRVVDLK